MPTMGSSSDRERQSRQQQRRCLQPSSPDINKTAPAEPEHSDISSGGDCASYNNTTKKNDDDDDDDDDVCMEDSTTVSTFGHEEDLSPSLRTRNSHDSNDSNSNISSSSSSNNTDNNDVVFDEDECMEDAPATVASTIGEPPPPSLSSSPPSTLVTDTNTNTARNRTGSRSSRVVRFGTVETREYPMTLGANPATRIGAPVCLGWDYRTVRTVSLEEDEHRNRRRRRYRAPGYGFYLNYYQRWAIVDKAGCSREEVFEAERIIRWDHLKRKMSELGSFPVLWIRSWGIESGRRRSRRFVKRYRKEHGLDEFGRRESAAR